jgi:hypothetical protein
METAFAVAFAEWLRRYEKEPERYAAEYGKPEQYGPGAAAYFVRILNELSEGKPWNTLGQGA